jgi:hypothetical protein
MAAGSGRVKTMSGGGGLSSSSCVAVWSPERSSWRTRQLSLLSTEADLSEPFSEPWQRSGSMRAGRVYELPTSGLRIGETDSSCSRGGQLWPTPDASAANDGEGVAGWEARREREKEKGQNGNGFGTPLSVAVRLWPTARARDYKGPGYGDDLPTQAARTWPTPTAGDSKDSGAAGYSTESGRHSGTTLTDAVVRGPKAEGKLNPDWVECLMGLPSGWTSIVGLPRPVRSKLFGSRAAPSRARRRTGAPA